MNPTLSEKDISNIKRDWANAAPLDGPKRINKKRRTNKSMRILVTAGPTREFIDPVRFISNPSTGHMGYVLAKAAKKKNHRVTVVSGPVKLKPPKGVKIINTVTAAEMSKAVKRQFKKADCLIMSAAVCDFKPQTAHKHKIKKKVSKRKLSLIRNPDILLWAGRNKQKRIVVGFCLESKGLIKSAKQKLKAKNADIMVANRIDKQTTVFGNRPTEVSILENNSVERIGPESKEKIAQILLDKIEGLWYRKT